MSREELTTTVGKIDGQNKKYASSHTIYDMIRCEVPEVQARGANGVVLIPSTRAEKNNYCLSGFLTVIISSSS